MPKGCVYGQGWPEKPTHCQFEDLEGRRFGKLAVVAYAGLKPGRQNKVCWVCRCDCGRWRYIAGLALKSGSSSTCGCGRIAAITRHGMTAGKRQGRSSRAYKIWCGVKRRCLNPDDPAYHHYGGRGIELCGRWHDFRSFYADMGDPPTQKHTIERKDTNGNYEPDNCCWATMKDQLRNTRRTRRISFRGRTQCLTAWADEFGITPQGLAGRLDAGWPVELALTHPLMPLGGYRRWARPVTT